MTVRIINSYVEQIHSFGVLLNIGTTAETIELQRIRQITELENLIKNKTDLITAQQTLGIRHHHPYITRALAEKTEMICQAAKEQHYRLYEAEEVITAFIEQINSFPVIYNTTSRHHIDEQRRTLIMQFAELERRIKSTDELAQTQRIMGVVGLHPRLEQVFANKIMMIRQASEEQHYRLNQAEEVITAFIEQINSFPVIYNATNRHHIDDQRRTLIVQFANLERIIRNSDELGQAQRIMGIADLHPRLEQAFANKIMIIREKAEQIKNKIIPQNEVKQDTRQINFAPHVQTTDNTTPTIDLWRLFSTKTDSIQISKETVTAHPSS